MSNYNKMLRKFTTGLFILLLTMPLIAQITYDFEDLSLSDWTQSQPGHWEISTNQPINGIASLHHAYDASTSGHDQISLQTNLDLSQGTTVWKFKIRHAYNPSSNNNWAVILASDRDAGYMSAGSNFNGYAIGVDLFNLSDDTLTLFRIDAGSAVKILKTPVNWQSEVGTSSAAAIVVTHSSTGQWQVYFSLSNNYDSLQLLGSATDQTYTDASYFGIYYEYTSAQDQKLWFDDLQIIAMRGQQNATFTLSPATDTIPSTTTTNPGIAIANLTVNVPASDTAPVVINQIILTPSANNQITDWTEFFAGIMFNDGQTNYTGIINQNTLVFNTNITIQPGDSLQGTIYAWIKPNNIATDNQKTGFLLTENQIICNPSYNSLQANQSQSSANTYSVTATQLVFDQVPLSVKPGKNFYIKLLATDQYNNIDLDASYQITLSVETGSGALSSATGLTKTMTAGSVEWTDLNYDTQDRFRLKAYTPGLGAFLSPYIQGSNYIYFLKDDFEDADISDWIENSPGHWTASDQNPINGTYSLHHSFDNTEAATEWIAYKLPFIDLTDTTVVWKFSLRYDNSSPSSSNNWNVVLMADNNPVTSASFNGYGIGIDWNETNDLITLWKITNGSPSALATSTINYEQQISAGKTVYFQITRTKTGQWTVEMDTTQGFAFQSIATASDNEFLTANYFAVRYQYTSTKDRLLTMDDIYFGQPIPDTVPPFFDTAIAISSDTVVVYFTEPVNTASLLSGNFTIDDTIACTGFSTITPRTIKLTLSDTLSENILHTLKTTNIEDLAGNISPLLTATIKWTALHVTSITFPDSMHITLSFNRQIDTSSVQASDFTLSPYSGSISSIQKTPTQITLTLSNALTQLKQYFISNPHIKDLNGNTLKDKNISFIFYIPHLGDVVVNELMVDVSPAPPALPAYKYIELYNRTSAEINLNAWTITIGDHTITIDNQVVIKPHSFAIICSPQAQDYFSHLAPVAPVLNEAYLSTTGKTIKLTGYNGQIIDQITYSQNWYNDPDKDNGGWALERIDPGNLCNQDNNWHASLNPIGGTPGFTNSVFGSNPDTTKPIVIGLQPVSSTVLNLEFNKPLAPSQITQQINYVLNSTATPLIIEQSQDNAHTLVLHFLVNFADGQNTLLVRNLTDLCGNKITDTLLTFTYQKIHPVNVEPISQTLLKIYFSEPVQSTSAQAVTNYFISDGIGRPQLATRDNQNPQIVYLILSDSLTLDRTYSISIAHVLDLNSNECDSTVLSFTPHTPQPYDIVFNEFMTDISPAPEGLPQVKYIELFNTRPFDIWLSNWHLDIDGKDYTLPSCKIPARSFLLLTSEDNTSYTGALPLLNDTYVKTNAFYTLFSPDYKTIDFVPLNGTFFGQQAPDGGIAAERINPYLSCETQSNWTASQNPAGGTPLAVNSVFDSTTTANPLHIIDFQIINSRMLNLTFNRPLINGSVLNHNNFSINNENVTFATLKNYQTLYLTSTSDFNEGDNTLTISITDDCGGSFNETFTFNYQFIHIKKIVPIDTNMLVVIFSETPVKNVFTPQNYVLNNTTQPDKIILDKQDSTQVYLIFPVPFQDGTNTIHISGIKDFYDHQIPDYEAQFTYHLPRRGDVVINEILFDPLPGGAKYVEIYNTSDYPIYLNSVSLANITDSTLDNIKPLTDDYITLDPHTYLCITTDTANVKQTYPTHGTNFLQITALPSLPSTDGNIAIISTDSVLDFLQYSDQMHSTLIRDPEGVALERINPALPTSDKNNWTSAAETVGWGTPAMRNSQYKSIDSLTSVNAQLSLSDETISPDQDGYQDNMIIRITAGEPQLYADIVIINQHGRPIKTLANNTLLATENTFIWDGTDNNGLVTAPGIYIIIAKIYSTDGRTTVIKKAIALTKHIK